MPHLTKIGNDRSASAVAASPYPAGTNPFSVVADPSGRFAYAINSGDNTVTGYSINSTSGALTPVAGSPFPTGASPATPAIDPTGRFLYVPNYNSNTISVFSIDSSTGTLTNVAGSVLSPMYEPVAAAVDPTGRFLFVANQGGTAYGVCTPTVYPCGVAAYTIDAVTGVLNPVPDSPFSAGPEPSSLVVDPSGRFLYVSNQSTDTTFEFFIDPVSGSLTKLGSTTPIEGASVAITVEPLGRFAYTTNALAYTIDPSTGILTQIPDFTFPLGMVPFSITTDASARFVYVANQGGGVSAYAIDDSSGKLTPISGSPFAAGTAPISVTTTAVRR